MSELSTSEANASQNTKEEPSVVEGGAVVEDRKTISQGNPSHEESQESNPSESLERSPSQATTDQASNTADGEPALGVVDEDKNGTASPPAADSGDTEQEINNLNAAAEEILDTSSDEATSEPSASGQAGGNETNEMATTTSRADSAGSHSIDEEEGNEKDKDENKKDSSTDDDEKNVQYQSVDASKDVLMVDTATASRNDAKESVNSAKENDEESKTDQVNTGHEPGDPAPGNPSTNIQPELPDKEEEKIEEGAAPGSPGKASASDGDLESTKLQDGETKQSEGENTTNLLTLSTNNIEDLSSPEFVNHGLALWERRRWQWLHDPHGEADTSGGGGSGKNETVTNHLKRTNGLKAKAVDVDDVIDIIFATPRQIREVHGGVPQQFPEPVALPQMVDILVDLW